MLTSYKNLGACHTFDCTGATTTKTRSVSHSTSNFPFQLSSTNTVLKRKKLFHGAIAMSQNWFLQDLLVRRMVPFQEGHSLQCQLGIRRIVIDKGPGIEQVKNFSRSVPNRHRASQKGIDNLFRNVTLPVGMLHDQGKAVVRKDIFVERPLLVGDVYGAGIEKSLFFFSHAAMAASAIVYWSQS